jgi:spore coat protein A, manganese oxidase
MELKRRDIMKLGGLGVAGAAAGSLLPVGDLIRAADPSTVDPALIPEPFTTSFRRPPVLRPYKRRRGPDGVWTDFYELCEEMTEARILKGGLTTKMFGYNGHVPGPTIKTARGRRVRLRVRNQLPSRHPAIGHETTTSVHLHGSASKPQYDGYANDVTPTGFYKDYHYPNFQRARTLWYHDHGAHHTAQNVFSGLVAQYHIHDKLERSLLPQGEFDVPLVVSDVAFREDGQLLFDDGGHSGTYGDVVLVNGRPWPVMKVKRRVYRFRILAASVSRSWRWRLGPGHPMTIVATDGGMMPKSQTVSEFRHGGAERYEVLIDFSKFRPGTRVVLNNLSNDNNRDFLNTDKVMAFDVVDDPFDKKDPTWNRIPERLVDCEVMRLRPGMEKRRRTLNVERFLGKWAINGQTWDDVIASDFQMLLADPNLGDVEMWTIANRSGGWFHPVHIHLVDFRIISRNGLPPHPWELGPKDVVYAGEGERVQLLMRFEHQRGRFMVHCHNLTHEDHDMMGQFAVGWKPGQADPNDPIRAARCRFDDLPG